MADLTPPVMAVHDNSYVTLLHTYVKTDSTLDPRSLQHLLWEGLVGDLGELVLAEEEALLAGAGLGSVHRTVKP